MRFSELTKPELERILDNANFTSEERVIFDLCIQGKTITQISLKVSLCERTINRKIAKIRNKISKLEALNGQSN